MEERRGDQPSPEPPDQPACPCGGGDHDPVRIGETLSSAGEPIAMLICPAQSPTGLGGVL